MARLRGKAGDDAKIAVRRQQALDLRITGKRYRQIAAELGVSYQTAFRDVQAALDEQRESNRERAEQLIELELTKLDQYEQYLQPGALLGDEKAINALLRVADRRARLLGLDAPAKQEHSGPDGGPIPIGQVRWIVVDPDETEGA